jgi:hypothetical protein
MDREITYNVVGGTTKRGRSNFDRDVAPDPRSTVTESAFAKLSFA